MLIIKTLLFFLRSVNNEDFIPYNNQPSLSGTYERPVPHRTQKLKKTHSLFKKNTIFID